MGTEILKSFGTLQSELEQAKSSLKGVDENIKRLIGRDPSEIIPRPGVKRGQQPERIVTTTGRVNRNLENDEPAPKRRNGNHVSVFKRLSDRPISYEDEFSQPQKQMISKVIVTPREVPSRQEALAAQSTDEKSKARNRRMFGALLGTLQKFQQEEIKLKKKEEKRAKVEKRIEEHEIKEKAEIKKERQELFLNRKKKQAEIKMIELKMIRMKEYAVWEEQQKPTMNFIRTKAKPHIFYLPRKLNDASKVLLETCKSEVEKKMDKKRQEVFDELQHIEERMKKNFEPKSKAVEETLKEDDEKHDSEDAHDKTDVEMEEPPFKNNETSAVEEESKEQSNEPAGNTYVEPENEDRPDISSGDAPKQDEKVQDTLTENHSDEQSVDKPVEANSEIQNGEVHKELNGEQDAVVNE